MKQSERQQNESLRLASREFEKELVGQDMKLKVNNNSERMIEQGRRSD